jgi:hypothetical protein
MRLRNSGTRPISKTAESLLRFVNVLDLASFLLLCNKNQRFQTESLLRSGFGLKSTKTTHLQKPVSIRSFEKPAKTTHLQPKIGASKFGKDWSLTDALIFNSDGTAPPLASAPAPTSSSSWVRIGQSKWKKRKKKWVVAEEKKGRTNGWGRNGCIGMGERLL